MSIPMPLVTFRAKMKLMKHISFSRMALLLLALAGSFASRAQDAPSENTLIEYPVLWHQTAAEYRALCYQAFNAATQQLQSLPKKKLRKGQLAIVTDIDETILDNSYYEAQQIKNGAEYSDTAWKRWTSRAAATAVPGAAAFLQLAASRGVTIFYISNRDTTEVASTVTNLKQLGLPNADNEHCLFLSNKSSKEERRNKVSGEYEIVMLLGDNLNDFTTAFEKKYIAERFAETDKVMNDWGRKFIVLPNAIYGEWLKAIYDYKKTLTPQQKKTIRTEVMKGY